jgi:hypothetical protein
VKKKRLTVEPIAGILKQAELGAPIAELFIAARSCTAPWSPQRCELKLMRERNARLKRIGRICAKVEAGLGNTPGFKASLSNVP